MFNFGTCIAFSNVSYNTSYAHRSLVRVVEQTVQKEEEHQVLGRGKIIYLIVSTIRPHMVDAVQTEDSPQEG